MKKRLVSALVPCVILLALQQPQSQGFEREAATICIALRRAEHSPATHQAGCQEEQARRRNDLRKIFLDFQRSESPRPVRVLVALDQRIRRLLDHRPSYNPCADDSEAYDSQWAEMGVQRGYWGGLVYSGALLLEAHKRDPNSAFRKFTLFSTVFGKTPPHGLGVMPNIGAAFRYVSEFPDGPFVKAALLTIADFHKDLFMVLRNNDRESYKYDCFKPYIKKRAIADQKIRAKRMAMHHYHKALKLDPSNERARTFLNDVSRETVQAWSFGAD